MRSEPPRMSRPRPPKIDSFLDRLEEELRQEIQLRPPQRASLLRRVLDRWGRLILRPVFHGGMVTIMFVVILTALRPQPATLLSDYAEAASSSQPVSIWVDVVTVPDPSPKFLPVVHRDRVPRFVSFAVTAQAPPLPERLVGLAPL